MSHGLQLLILSVVVLFPYFIMGVIARRWMDSKDKNVLNVIKELMKE